MKRMTLRGPALSLLAAASILLSAIPAQAETIDWIRQFGSRRFDRAWGTSIDASGNSYVAGQTDGQLPGQTHRGGTDAFVRAFDPAGNVLWTRQFGTGKYDAAYQTAVDGTSVYVIGETGGRLGASQLGESDAFIRKFDLLGNPLWTQQFGTKRVDFANNVVVDATQAYVVGVTAGRLPGETLIGDGDMFLIAFTLDGDEMWTQQYGTRKGDTGYANIVDATGVYTIGTTRGRLPGEQQAGERDIAVHRFGLDGAPVWVRQIGTPKDDHGFGIGVSAAGLFVGGLTFGGLAGEPDQRGDAWLRRMSKDTGASVWTRQFGGGQEDELRAIVIDGSSVHAVGNTSTTLGGQTPAGGFDAFTRTYADDGTVQSTFLVGTGRSDFALAAAGAAGLLVLVGATDGRFPDQPNPDGFDAFVAHVTSV